MVKFRMIPELYMNNNQNQRTFLMIVLGFAGNNVIRPIQQISADTTHDSTRLVVFHYDIPHGIIYTIFLDFFNYNVECHGL